MYDPVRNIYRTNEDVFFQNILFYSFPRKSIEELRLEKERLEIKSSEIENKLNDLDPL